MVFGVLLGLLMSCDTQGQTGKFVEATCPLELPADILESGKFLYGHMSVPEFFKHPGGKTLELAIAIFKCRTDTSLHDPLVLCSGGPGLSNMDDFVPALAGGLGDLFLQTRDVVIIETRGLKYSGSFLQIPELEELQLSLLNQNLTADQTIALYLDTLHAAYARFEKEGLNMSAFNTREISNEVAFVMKELGYGKFSFFGTSYGTEIAQYLMFNYPERLASVVMNGTMDITLGGHHMHTSLISTMEALFEELQSNSEYAEAYPDLKGRFLRKMAALNNSPDTLRLTYRKTMEEYDVLLNGNRVALWIFHQMYANTQIQMSIQKIVNGDYSEIIANPGLIFPVPEFSTGLNLSVFLSETKDIQPESIPVEGEYAVMVKGIALSLFGPYFWEQAQEVWPVNGAVPPAQIETDIPVLLLSGQMDYLCRPSYAKQFAQNQQNSYLFLFEDVAHSPVDKGECAIMMLKEFFDNPKRAPDASCMDGFHHEILVPEI